MTPSQRPPACEPAPCVQFASAIAQRWRASELPSLGDAISTLRASVHRQRELEVRRIDIPVERGRVLRRRVDHERVRMLSQVP